MKKENMKVKGRCGDIEYGYETRKNGAIRNHWFVRDRRTGATGYMRPGENCMNEAFKAARRLADNMAAQ